MKRLKIGEILSAAAPKRLLQIREKLTNKHIVNGDTYYNCGKFLLVVSKSRSGGEKLTVVANYTKLEIGTKIDKKHLTNKHTVSGETYYNCGESIVNSVISKSEKEIFTVVASYSVNNFYQLQTAAILSYLLKQEEIGNDDLEHFQTSCVGFGNSLLLMLESFEHLADLASRIDYDASGKVRWLVKKHWEKTGKPIEHAWTGFDSYSLSELCALGVRAADAKTMLKNRFEDKTFTLEKIYKFVFGNLCDIVGNKNKMSPSKIENSFSETMTINMRNIVSVYKFIRTSDMLALEHFQKERPVFVETLKYLSSNNLDLSTKDFENFITPPRIKKNLL